MTQAVANWYPDPNGRHEYRYWDGARWTDQVADGGRVSNDPITTAPAAGTRLDRLDSALTVGNEGQTDKIHQQVHAVGRQGAGIHGRVEGGAGTIFSEPVLVVNQKAKIIELNNQYGVFDQDGRQLARVDQVGQSTLKKAARLVSNLDQFMTHQLQISDASGQVVMNLTRPRKLLKSTVLVADGHGSEIGRIAQRNAIGKIHFGLEAGGRVLGSIQGENWRAWNFRIDDASGREVARITKTWEGLAKTMFTTADNYVVRIHERTPEPLNSLIVASALSIDTALKQDSRGLT